MRKAPVALAATLLAFGITAEARAQQQGSGYGMMDQQHMMGMDPDDWGSIPMMMHMRGMMMGQGSMPMMGMGRHVEGQLAFLKTELKITPAQESLWNGFAEAVRTTNQKMGDMMPCCGGPQVGMMQGGGTMMQQGAVMPSLPDRLERQEKMLSARLDALRSVKGPLASLYAAFSDEQKQAADQLIRPMGMMM